MIHLTPAQLRAIVDAAEAAYPEECCGLLVGRGTRVITVTRVVAAANVQAGSGDRFEVDPVVRFRLMRALEGGAERLVGHYHSHPDHPAAPSARDLAAAYEPDLVWLITAVEGGQAIHTTAHRLDERLRRFRPVGLRVAAAGGSAKNP